MPLSATTGNGSRRRHRQNPSNFTSPCCGKQRAARCTRVDRAPGFEDQARHIASDRVPVSPTHASVLTGRRGCPANRGSQWLAALTLLVRAKAHGYLLDTTPLRISNTRLVPIQKGANSIRPIQVGEVLLNTTRGVLARSCGKKLMVKFDV